ncbi:sulfite exporter TauE/SafE family protein [Thiotrichales bacterium 19X7-9]|nr:sulfite exporter TauE/SafE family protein [Thiotrichales bacterium 19X7-9]
MLLDILILITAFFGSLLAGLFGGGAGLIFTPAIFLFLSYNDPQASYLMQTSITTMITSMLLSGLVASFKQQRYKQINWEVVRWSAPLVIIGSIFGCFIIMMISSRVLIYFFAIATLILAIRSGFKLYRSSSKKTLLHSSWSFRIIGSFLLGMISTVSGAASFVVPFYERVGLNIKLAIGTTTIIVWLYSIFVAIVMIAFGLHQSNLPIGNIGYLNYRYLWLFMLPTIPGAMLGAKLSYYLPERQLKITFTLLLVVIGISMLFYN